MMIKGGGAGSDAVKELYIDFKDNGVITLYGKSERPVAQDVLSRILGESLKPILTQMNEYLDPTGFHIPIYDDYLDSGNTHLRVENIDYYAEWQMTQADAARVAAWSDCVECARALFLPISSRRGVKELSYVRVPGYRRASAPAAFVARRIVELQGTDGIRKNIIDSLMKSFPEFHGDAGRKRAVELYEEKIAEFSRNESRNESREQEDLPGCFCRMEMTERNVFRVTLENIASLHVLPMFEDYLRAILEISGDGQLLKRVCGFQKSIMAAEAAANEEESEEEEEEEEEESKSSSSLGSIRVINESESESETESESESESSESENKNRFRIREGGAKKTGLDAKKWKNWTWRRLEEQVPKLFENAKSYPRQCQGDLKPVILTPDEKSVIDAADADFDPSYTNALEYEYSEDGEKFFFICPKYWSVSQNRSISEKELDAKKYKVLDRGSNLDAISEEKEGEYVYKFTPHGFENKVLGPKFKEDRESKTPLPCCYVLSEKEKNATEEKATAKATTTAKTKQKTSNKPSAQETSYISEKTPPLEKHHFGFLPPQFEIFFRVDRRKFFNRTTKRPNNDVPFVLRYGVESYPSIQSFLACFAEIYAFYRGTPQTPSISQFADIVANSVTLDVFFSLNRNDRNNYNAYQQQQQQQQQHQQQQQQQQHQQQQKHYSSSLRYKDSELFKRLDMRSEDQRRLFEATVQDYENFLDFLRDPAQSKASPQFWQLFCSARLLGSEQDINLIVMEAYMEDAEEHVRVLCPSNPEIMNNYNVNRDHVILYKVGDYYELLCSFEQKSKKSDHRIEPVFRHNATSGIPPLIAEMPTILRKIHGEMRKCAKTKNTKIAEKEKDKEKAAIPLSTLLRDNKITIVNLVIYWDGLIVGVLNEKGQFVPCEPTPLPGGAAAATRHISEVAWRPFRETLAYLKSLESLDDAFSKAIKPVAAIVNDEGYIVGIRVQSGQFVETELEKLGEVVVEDLEIVEQPNPNDVDRALIAKIMGKGTLQAMSPVEIEHENYSAFRSIIRKKLRDYKFREVRRLIVQNGNGGLDVIMAALREIVGSSVRFFIDGTSDNNDNGESDKGILHIPRKNMVNGIDNEAFYFQRLADELVRYDRVRLYMLENTIQFTEIEYRIHDDELLISEAELLILGNQNIQ
jgi:hypothetical protein